MPQSRSSKGLPGVLALSFLKRLRFSLNRGLALSLCFFAISGGISLSANRAHAASFADSMGIAAGHYIIDPGSKIDFSVAQIGDGGITGRFPDFAGSFDFVARDFSKSRVDFTIRPASVAANEPRITSFLKSSAVFDAADFPVISFRSYRVERTGPESARIDGMLTAKGRTLAQSFTASLVDLDRGSIAFHVLGSVYRAPFGMEIGVPIYSNVVRFDMMLKAIGAELRMNSSSARQNIWRSRGQSYGRVALLFHWTVAFLFLAQIPRGYLTQATGSRPALQFQLYQWHKSVGFLVLALSALRLAWLWFDGRPEKAARATPLEKVMASIARITLYLATLIVPLTGWAIASASPLRIPSYAFNILLIPPLPLAASDAAEAFWSNLHAILAYGAGAVAAIHIAAALDHHFRRKDRTLRRMLRSGGGGNPAKDTGHFMER